MIGLYSQHQHSDNSGNGFLWGIQASGVMMKTFPTMHDAEKISFI
jgi:hypothetical protein